MYDFQLFELFKYLNKLKFLASTKSTNKIEFFLKTLSFQFKVAFIFETLILSQIMFVPSTEFPERKLYL